MAPFKKNLTPLSKGGAIHKHAGKGSQMAPMPNRSAISALSNPATNSINNYAKAAPMPQPPPSPPDGGGLGSGNWGGNGM